MALPQLRTSYTLSQALQGLLPPQGFLQGLLPQQLQAPAMAGGQQVGKH
jgi:hypothetical protein